MAIVAVVGLIVTSAIIIIIIICWVRERPKNHSTTEDLSYSTSRNPNSANGSVQHTDLVSPGAKLEECPDETTEQGDHGSLSSGGEKEGKSTSRKSICRILLIVIYLALLHR